MVVTMLAGGLVNLGCIEMAAVEPAASDVAEELRPGGYSCDGSDWSSGRVRWLVV